MDKNLWRQFSVSGAGRMTKVNSITIDRAIRLVENQRTKKPAPDNNKSLIQSASMLGEDSQLNGSPGDKNTSNDGLREE